MTGFFTDHANNKVLDLFFGAATYTPPATLYFGLSTNLSNKLGAVSEPPPTSGYARVAVANNNTNFTRSDAESVTFNATAVTFPEPTADWGEIQSLFLADDPRPGYGNVLVMADLPTTKTIKGGDATPLVNPAAWAVTYT